MVGYLVKLASWSLLESNTLEGESPVDEADILDPKKSRATWISRLNTAELTANPKHRFKSDSALVPRGKAEKYS